MEVTRIATTERQKRNFELYDSRQVQRRPTEDTRRTVVKLSDPRVSPGEPTLHVSEISMCIFFLFFNNEVCTVHYTITKHAVMWMLSLIHI